jgi:hypothetical protein
MDPKPPDDAPPQALPPSPPPLLDYPSPAPPPDPGTERWSEVLRALLIVFGALAVLFFGGFGVCGLLGRGCG